MASNQSALSSNRAAIVWLTGFSGSGKSTIANLASLKLNEAGLHTFVLDGDNIRLGLSNDLGFSDVDRSENCRRVAHVARLLADAGLIVIVSLISPLQAHRSFARQVSGDILFLEVFVDTPLEVCERRDVKGLYIGARKGTIQNFTGISSQYEIPLEPDLHLFAGKTPPSELAGTLVDRIVNSFDRS